MKVGLGESLNWLKKRCELKMRSQEDAKAFGLGTVRWELQSTATGNSTGGAHWGSSWKNSG